MANDDTDDTTSRRGPLTPAELETLAELYGATGNASEVAEQLGVSVSTVTRALARLGAQNRAKLQERALSRGLLRGGELLTQTAESVAEILRCEAESGPSLEAKDYAGLARALAMLVGTTAKLDEREERRRQARLTRRKTKAEIEALRKGLLPPADQLLMLLAGLSREDKVRLRDTLRAQAAQAATAGGAPEPDDGA
jgi:DNA-binding MarR family transcriptional regulator